MLLRNAAQSLLASTRTLPSSSSAAIPSLLSAFSHFSLSGPSTSSSSSTSILASSSRHPSHNFQQSRTKLTLTPRRSKYRKAFKGRIPVHTGGSTAGTTIEHGEFGLRVKDRPSRLSAKQLSSAHEALRRGIKPVKGAKVYIRVFPDIPVCIKGNETRMGKGKGTFEYWACRAPIGKVIFEVGGGGIAEQVAKDALRLAAAKLPVQTEFITRQTTPRLGNLVVATHNKPANPSSLPADSPAAVKVPVEEVVQSTEVPTA